MLLFFQFVYAFLVVFESNYTLVDTAAISLVFLFLFKLNSSFLFFIFFWGVSPYLTLDSNPYIIRNSLQTDFDDEDYAESISEEQYIETNVNGEVDRKKDLKDILKKRWSQRHPNENTTHPSILTSAVHKRKSDRKGELTENSLSSLDNDGRDNVDGKVSSVQYSSNDAQHVLREEEDIECSHSCEMEQKSLISREIAVVSTESTA